MSNMKNTQQIQEDKIIIRNYNKEDYKMLASWWHEHLQLAPREDMLPPDTTYILEYDNQPVLSACLYLMNCPGASMLENLISNPKHESLERKILVSYLIKYIEREAKKRGYNTLVLFSYQDKLKIRYEELGFVKTLDNVTTFAKEVN